MKTHEGIIFFDQIPKGTSQMKRCNHRTGVFFEGKELSEARRQYEEQLLHILPDEKFVGPVKVCFIFEYYTKDKKKKGNPKTSRPDCDNMVKLLLDCMTRLGFWEDDRQISYLKVIKRWSSTEKAKLWIFIEEDW